MPNFLLPQLQQKSKKNRFGVCDTPPPPDSHAYIDERNGGDWLAVVENYYGEEIAFVPVDNSIILKRPDGNPDKRCDGLLFYQQTIIFIELKNRNTKGKGWIVDGEDQLRSTIKHFEHTLDAVRFNNKKAYICNKANPLFRRGQMARMNNFLLIQNMF